MLELGKAPLIGAMVDGMQVRDAFALKRFGYFLLEAAADGCDGNLYGSDDTILAQCRLHGRSLECGSAQTQ